MLLHYSHTFTPLSLPHTILTHHSSPYRALLYLHHTPYKQYHASTTHYTRISPFSLTLYTITILPTVTHHHHHTPPQTFTTVHTTDYTILPHCNTSPPHTTPHTPHNIKQTPFLSPRTGFGVGNFIRSQFKTKKSLVLVTKGQERTTSIQDITRHALLRSLPSQARLTSHDPHAHLSIDTTRDYSIREKRAEERER